MWSFPIPWDSHIFTPLNNYLSYASTFIPVFHSFSYLVKILPNILQLMVYQYCFCYSSLWSYGCSIYKFRSTGNIASYTTGYWLSRWLVWQFFSYLVRMYAPKTNQYNAPGDSINITILVSCTIIPSTLHSSTFHQKVWISPQYLVYTFIILTPYLALPHMYTLSIILLPYKRPGLMLTAPITLNYFLAPHHIW